MKAPAPGSDALLDGLRVRAGQIVLSLDDPGVLAGIGLFETLALRRGRVLDLELHLERLANGCERLSVPLPPVGTLRRELLEIGGSRGEEHGWVKVICTRGGRRAVFAGPFPSQQVGRAVSAIVLPWRRNPADPLVGFKTLNYGASTLGLELARRRGADEGLWLNTRGHLAEACTANLFVVQGRRLFTPRPQDGILPGVVRGQVLEAARGLGFLVHAGKLRLPRLERASEAFLTSSVAGVRPLVKLDGRDVGRGVPGTATRRLAAEVERHRTAEA